MPEQTQPYYISHLWQVIDSLEQRSPFLLCEKELSFIACLRALSHSALCLYVRLAHRKGPLFRIDKICYDEIADLKAALDELMETGLATRCGDNSTPAQIFACFTYVELKTCLETCLGDSLPKNLSRRADILGFIEDSAQTLAALRVLLDTMPLIGIETETLAFLRFLFFGEHVENLSGFVVRELGHIVNEDISTVHLTAAFINREDALSCYVLSTQLQAFRQKRDTYAAPEMMAWWEDVKPARGALGHKAVSLFDGIVKRLGAWLERRGEFEFALYIYSQSPAPPARERRARLLAKLNRKQEALAFCLSCLEAPANDAEAYALQQFYNRLSGKERSSAARRLLKDAAPLIIARSDGHVETCVLDYYQALGWQGVHSENMLWNAMFGLSFWDIIYDPSLAHFHHPLQFAPSDLTTPQFYNTRKTLFSQRLALFDDKQAVLDLVTSFHHRKHGIHNPFVGWHAALLTLVQVLIDKVPLALHAQILAHMAKDLKHRTTGFPDLFLWRDDAYCFVEVKSPNDQLQPHQYQWLRFFESIGLNARVQPVLWDVAKTG